MGQYSDAVHNIFVELARDEQAHVTGIQAYLGMAMYPITSTVNCPFSIHCPCMLVMSIECIRLNICFY